MPAEPSGEEEGSRLDGVEGGENGVEELLKGGDIGTGTEMPDDTGEVELLIGTTEVSRELRRLTCNQQQQYQH